MACCVLIMAFIAQLFELRRKVRRALGLPVGDRYDDEPLPGLFSLWVDKLRGVLHSDVTRAVLVGLIFATVAIVVIVVPRG